LPCFLFCDAVLAARKAEALNSQQSNSSGSEEEAMTINDLPAIMGTVLIVAGLALVGIYTRFRTEGSERSVQAGALLIVVGAVLLGVSLFVPRAK
jgi:drug/metabolite transporter (DMT)-like permease